jgi:acetyl-CoA acetyltransferase
VIAGDEVEEVVLGCVLLAGGGQNPARHFHDRRGSSKEVPSTTAGAFDYRARRWYAR